jgi:phage terminase large subunit-like protein
MLCEEQGIVISSIHFDRWRAKDFFASCERTGFASLAERKEVGQGYQSISPRLEALETVLLQNRLRCDNHPVLNMGFAAAVVQSDPAGNRKLDKRKENGPKIDAVIALLMAAFPLVVKEEALGEDLSHWIG